MIERNAKNDFKKVLLIVFIIICFIGIIYSLFNIINWKKDVDSNKNIKKDTETKISIHNDDFNINFEALKKQNSDTVAYLKINGTNIDYVVVKGSDNDYYLNHNFNKEYNIAGWIFADYHNSFDSNDKNIVIFGHNMKDGSMFGTLKNTLSENWQTNDNNLNILFVTEQKEYKYRVFSTYVIEPEDYYINTIFNSDREYENFLNKIKSRSNHNYNIDVNKNDKVLTLSSCNNNGTKRVVLHAKLINE